MVDLISAFVETSPVTSVGAFLAMNCIVTPKALFVFYHDLSQNSTSFHVIIYISSMPCEQESCPFFDSEYCNYLDPAECDFMKIFQAPEKSYYPPSLLYMKFSYLDEWRHIPADEVYTISAAYDFEQAVYAFRERHGSQGTLMVFATEDLIEWWVWGYIPVGETCKG